MIKTLVIYESKYGFTREIAKDCALVLGSSISTHVDKINKDINNYDIVAICTPVYNDVIPDSIMRFVNQNAELLRKKKIVLFVSCLEVDYGQKYLKKLSSILGKSVVWQETVGANLDTSHLDDKDYEELKKLCEKEEISFKDNNLFARDKFLLRLTKLKHLIGEHKVTLKREEGMKLAEGYLNARNVCTLGTGYLRDIAANPMEYIYRDGFIYILSEGGEKIYYILQNPNVSIAVYGGSDSEQLAGLQIIGKAAMVDNTAEEYRYIMGENGFNQEALDNMPVTLYLIKVSIEKIEFIYHGDDKLDYNIKQVYNN